MDYQTRLALGVLIPLISFFILALRGHKFGKPYASWVALAAIGASCLLSTSVLIGWLGCSPEQKAVLSAGAARFDWAVLGSIPLTVGVKLDSLTVIMYFMVTFIAFWIHFFSIGYMAGHSDEVDGVSKYHRFFTYLSLFCFSMLGLVISSSLLFLFIFWELVGLCSYLLIGFYFDKKFASNAAMKAFITNRVGDLGFIVGLMMVVFYLGTLDLDQAAAKFAYQYAGGDVAQQTGIFVSSYKLFGFEMSGMAVATMMGIGLFCGAMGKSAQVPLQVWLPDAMAGPTPVSALIHAATMVAAGVYLVARVFRLLTPDAQFFIAVIGCITLTMAALIAIVQTDIKKVLAYSTLSQLGYMIFGMGVGAWVAALFHLMTHAFFKAMLFLGSGQVIEGCHHEQDIRKMGGLRKKMPITCWTFFIGVLAIAGFGMPGTHWGLGGFFSKDEILAVAYERAFNLGGETAHEDGGEHGQNVEFRMENLEGRAPVRLVSDRDSGHSQFSILNSQFLAAADEHGEAEHGGEAGHVGGGAGHAGHGGHGATGTKEKLAIAAHLPKLPKWMFFLPICIAYVTPFYMMRVWWLTFCGKPRDHHVHEHAHESGMMVIPLVALAFGTFWCSYNVLGTFRPMLVEAARVATNSSTVVAIDGEAHGLEEAAKGTMMTLNHAPEVSAHGWLKTWVGWSWLIGMGLAWLVYRGGLHFAASIKRLPGVGLAHLTLERKFFFDDLYDNVLVGGTVVFAFACRAFDKTIVDGLVNGMAFITKALAFFAGRQLDMSVRKGDIGLVDAVVNGMGGAAMWVAAEVRRPQSGRIRQYILLAAGSAAVVLFLILYRTSIADWWVETFRQNAAAAAQ